MGLSTLALLLSLVWAAIYSLHYLLNLSSSRSLLPTAFAKGAYPCKVVLKFLRLRVETTSWNIQHDSLAAFLARRHNPWTNILFLFYSMGSVFCILGMLGSVAILLWTCWQLSVPLSRALLHDVAPSGYSPNSPMKRSLKTGKPAPSAPDWLEVPSLKLIIPGVTVPLDHLPLALAAVFVAQMVHEIGHAICAALESVPLLSVGASLFIFLPSAFVKLSSAAIEVLAPAGHLRIIAAGPFHNLIFWCILAAAGNTRIGGMLWSFSYRNISSVGRVVIAVEPHSPLHSHLPRGSFVTALDDTRLGDSTGTFDSWATFAAKPEVYTTNGWCVQRSWYFGKSQDCCAPDKDTTKSSLSCFTSLDLPPEMRCLDPIPILTVHNYPKDHRCASGAECADGTLCVRPLDSEQLSRVTIQLPPLRLSDSIADEEVILWKGPRSELLEQVQVGTLLPRFRFLPLWLPSTAELLLEYLKVATLSLYFFNLLPLPFLDGSKMLDILIAIPIALAGWDVEAVVPTGRPRPKYFGRIIRSNVAMLLGLAVTLTFIHMCILVIYGSK